MNHQHVHPEDAPSFWRSRYALGLIVIGAVAGYFLLTEHLAHVMGALPFLLLLACPLMHVFMHHGQGGQGGPAHQAQDGGSREAAEKPDPAKRGDSP